jgi:hypothetical protein
MQIQKTELGNLEKSIQNQFWVIFHDGFVTAAYRQAGARGEGAMGL